MGRSGKIKKRLSSSIQLTRSQVNDQSEPSPKKALESIADFSGIQISYDHIDHTGSTVVSDTELRRLSRFIDGDIFHNVWNGDWSKAADVIEAAVPGFDKEGFLKEVEGISPVGHHDYLEALNHYLENDASVLQRNDYYYAISGNAIDSPLSEEVFDKAREHPEKNIRDNIARKITLETIAQNPASNKYVSFDFPSEDDWFAQENIQLISAAVKNNGANPDILSGAFFQDNPRNLIGVSQISSPVSSEIVQGSLRSGGGDTYILEDGRVISSSSAFKTKLDGKEAEVIFDYKENQDGTSVSVANGGSGLKITVAQSATDKLVVKAKINNSDQTVEVVDVNLKDGENINSWAMNKLEEIIIKTRKEREKAAQDPNQQADRLLG